MALLVIVARFMLVFVMRTVNRVYSEFVELSRAVRPTASSKILMFGSD